MRSVIAESGPVKANPHYTFLPRSPFREHGCDMRPVVLNAGLPRRRKLERMSRRSVLWMRIVRDQQIIPPHFVHRDQIFNRPAERLKRIKLVKIADVLAHKRLAINNQGDRVLQIGAYCQYRARNRNSRDCAGSITAGPPQHDGAELSCASHGIVDTARNRPLAD